MPHLHATSNRAEHIFPVGTHRAHVHITHMHTDTDSHRENTDRIVSVLHTWGLAQPCMPGMGGRAVCERQELHQKGLKKEFQGSEFEL